METVKQLEIRLAELSLKLGALEERVAYLEDKCSLGHALTITNSTPRGEPYYLKLGHHQPKLDGGSQTIA